jgi:hypothetical protein
VHIPCEPEEYFEKMTKMSSLFDFSNLDEDNPLYSTYNAGVPGKFKVEMEAIKEFVGLNSKCYSILRDPIKKEGGNTGIQEESEQESEEESGEDEEEESESEDDGEVSIQACKGVPSAFMKNTKHQYYASILDNEQLGYIQSKHIRAKGQQLVTLTQTKKGFTPLDIKRFYLNATETLAYGNKRIKLLQQDTTRFFLNSTENLAFGNKRIKLLPQGDIRSVDNEELR